MGKGTNLLNIKCILGGLSDEIQIEDLLKYIPNGSVRLTNTSLDWSHLFDLENLDNFEASIIINSNSSQGVQLALHRNNNNENTYLVRVGANTDSLKRVVSLKNNGVDEQYEISGSYAANTNMVLKIKRENGVITGTIDGTSKTFVNPPTSLRYIGLESWFNIKTINFSDFKIREL